MDTMANDGIEKRFAENEAALIEAKTALAIRLQVLENAQGKTDAKLDMLITGMNNLDKSLAVNNARRAETCPHREEWFAGSERMRLELKERLDTITNLLTTKASANDIADLRKLLDGKVDKQDVSVRVSTLRSLWDFAARIAPWAITVAVAAGWIGRP